MTEISESSRQAEGDINGGDAEVDGTHAGEEHVEVENANVIDSDAQGSPTNSKYDLDNDQVKDPPTPVMTLALPNVPLHSPSDIIGTPFATDSAPYEYPFPDPSATTITDRDGLPFSSPWTNLSHSSSFPSLLSGSSFQVSSSSSTLPSLSTPPSIMSHFPPDVPHTYSSTHPKLRPINPPVPPALVKKRQRWSLDLLRRRSSGGSSSDVGPLSSPEALSETSVRVSGAFRPDPTNQEVVTIDSHQQQITAMGENDTPVQRPH